MQPAILISIIIGILYPGYIILTYERVNEKIKRSQAWRLVDYKKTIFIFWLLTFLVAGNNAYSKDQDVPLGLAFEPTIPAFTVFVLVGAIIIFLFSQLRLDQKSAGAVQAKMKDVFHYLPKSKKELWWFVALSVSAGICEEIIFRGFLVGFLSQELPIWVAVVGANLVFAFTHIGSGKQNLISSFILGLIFSAVYYFTGSLWPVIFLHTAIDLYSGILGFKAFMMEKEGMKVS